MKIRVHILVSKFSSFTLRSYYREVEQGDLAKIPIAVISESSDHSRIAAFTCTNAIVNELKKRMEDSLKKAILWGDGCSSQFRSKYVFALMTHFDKLVQLEWHYHKAQHGKGPMDDVGGTIKRVVFGLVKSNKIKISTAEEIATEASKTVSSIPFNQSTFPKMMR